jgi:hypothetical protein
MQLIMPVIRLARLFPDDAPPSLSVAAFLQRLRQTAEVLDDVDTSSRIDKQVTAALEDLRLRLQILPSPES